MAFEEIERLKERVDRDPNSKLFVPLAEEYKKAGMFDEAIDVLIRGLERHPNYMSARVSLGKVYLEKGMLDEAGTEFEKVVSAIPDNLYAHKKLAEIYRELGERDKAVEEFRKVLELNPADEDAARSLANLKGGLTVQPEVTEAVKAMLKEEKPSETEKLRELEEVSFTAEEEIKETVEEPEGLPEKEMFLSEEAFKESQIADHYISQGRYAEALDIYRRLLSIEPSNVYILQRIEELRALLKLLGKGKEELIARLNSFLEGVKKRRDEFFGTP